jgi:hypothetical protein
MEDILAVILIFGGGTLVALAMSPIGRAIGARISGQAAAGSSDELKSLRESQESLATELDTARQDIAELQERLDFTERMLARRRDDPALPPESLPRK